MSRKRQPRVLKPERGKGHLVAIVVISGTPTVVPDWRPAPYPTTKKPVTIRWVLGGRLDWDRSGIKMTDTHWKTAWGEPSLNKVTNQYELKVSDGPKNKVAYKYTAYVTRDKNKKTEKSFLIDPEVEYDDEFE